MRRSQILASALACLSAVYATSVQDDAFIPLLSRISRRSSGLAKRVGTGGKCGAAAGNAVCDAGLCCSTDGVCGTGVSFCGAPGCQLSFGPACDGNKLPPGKDTSTVARPLFGNVPYGVDISHCTINGKVAITFDDGPYLYTSDLLDLLKRNNARATFFVTGANGGKGQIQDAATGYPSVIQRMIADGHQIGSHTWSHQDMSAITAAQRRDQIIRNEIALVDVLGFFPTYLRPPYTRFNADTLADLKTLGYHVLNYDVDTRDWQGDYTYAQNLYTSILGGHSPASSSWIAIAHDIQPQTVKTFAQYMIDQARKLGYELVTVGECLGDAPTNWYRDPATGQSISSLKLAAANIGSQNSGQSSPSSAASSAAAASSSATSVLAVSPTSTSAKATSASATTNPASSASTSVSVPKPTTTTTMDFFGAGTSDSSSTSSSGTPQAASTTGAAPVSSTKSAGVRNARTAGLSLSLLCGLVMLRLAS